MKNLDWFKKRKADLEKEMENFSSKLTELQQNRTAIEEQINAAIDSGDYASVDKLTAKETDLDTRIRAAEKILERKKEMCSFPREAVIEASNAEMKRYQTQITGKMGEADKYHKLYFQKLIEAGEIAKEANDIRQDYLYLAGMDRDLSGEFESIHAGFAPGHPLSVPEINVIRSIRPDGLMLVNLLWN